jgi:hypothetical protein
LIVTSEEYSEQRVLKTYAWMQATEASNAINIRQKIKTIITIGVINPEQGFLRRTIRIWPAVILADNRIARVAGRMICLNVSTNTMAGDRSIGLPVGTR